MSVIRQSKKYHANRVQITSRYSDRFVHTSPSVLKIRYVGVLQFWIHRHLSGYVNCLIKITYWFDCFIRIFTLVLIKYCGTSWVYDAFENVFLYIICKGSTFHFIFMSSHLLSAPPPTTTSCLFLARVLVWV